MLVAGEVARDCIFIVICMVTVLVSGKLTFGKNNGWRELFDNAMFWVFLLYIVAIVVTVIRIPFIGYGWINPDLFTILYNWAASLILTVSSLIPLKLVKTRIANGTLANTGTSSSRRSGSAAIGSNLIPILFGAALYVVLLVVTIVVGFTQVMTIPNILLAWRIFFFINLLIEVAALTACLAIFSGTTLESNFKWYLGSTLWMRGGIGISIVMKYADILPTWSLKIIHMMFIITGLWFYNKKLNDKAKRRITGTGGRVTPGSTAMTGNTEASVLEK